MTLLCLFKEIVDNAPLDVVESLNRRSFRYQDEYNHVNAERCGLILDVNDRRVTVKLNVKDQTTVLREIVPVRSQTLHVNILESDLTEDEINMFKGKVQQWLSP